ncbi:MAG: class I SAM-dependent methyltransferase [Actinomycetota bacterium]
MSDTGFTLTVPGTSLQLRDENGQLVHGEHRFDRITGAVWDLTPADRRADLDRFAIDYAAVRAAEGRELGPDAVRRLPDIDPGHELASMWSQRKASWLSLRDQLPSSSEGRTVLDVGAGCGWLAARLADAGWRAAAIDITVDGGDGLAAARHHDADLLLARADMGALPFAQGSIDLVVFNASLHYAADVAASLREAQRVIRSNGRVVVMDSPIFHDTAAGAAMVQEFDRSVHQRHGLAPAAHQGPGFVTWDELVPFDLARIDPADGFRDRFHRWRGARRAGREVAQRPLLISSSEVAP